MKITSKLLEKFDAPEEFKEVFHKNYPSGAELAEIIKNMNLDCLYFLKKYFSFTKEEVEIYNKRCNIDENSSLIWESHDIEFSKDIARSSDIRDSTHVKDSVKVDKSNDIYSSSNVQRSENIILGENVKRSSCLISCKNASNSTNAFAANDISWSNNIMSSKSIEESSFIYSSENLEDCFFCGFCENLKHCLFCLGLTEGEYMIFNEEVSPEEFMDWKEELLLVLSAEKSEFIKINYQNHVQEKRLTFSSRFDSIFNGLSKKFYGWVGNVINFSDDLFLGLFFRDQEEFENEINL